MYCSRKRQRQVHIELYTARLTTYMWTAMDRVRAGRGRGSVILWIRKECVWCFSTVYMIDLSPKCVLIIIKAIGRPQSGVDNGPDTTTAPHRLAGGGYTDNANRVPGHFER